MKKRILLVVVLFLLLAALVYAVLLRPLPPSPATRLEGEATEQVQDSGQTQDSEQASPVRLTPEQIRDGILSPAVSYHPGTAGSSLKSAQAAASVIAFITENELRYADEAQLDQLMGDAASLLSEDEQEWLRENLPGMIALIDSVFSDYTEVSGQFDDAGVDDTIRTVLEGEHAAKDWARVRASLSKLAGSDEAA